MSGTESLPQPGYGTWWVIDVQIPGECEVLAGDRRGAGRSVRRALWGPAARIVPEVLRTVADSGQPYARCSKPIHDVVYRVQALPALGPFGAVHAVLCCVVPAGQPLPPAPLVGAWQWDIPARTGHGTEALFDMFDTPAQLRGSYGMAQYLSRISVPSTPVALDLWARVQTATTEDVLYATVQREREGHSRWYTMCGRPVFDAGDTPVAFRGVTIDVSDLPVPTSTAPTDELLVAVLAQIDLALAVVDAVHQHIVRWLTAPAAGVAWPPNAYLAQLVHPDDRGELDRLCTPPAELPVGASVRGQVRLPATAGGWVAAELDARLYLRDEITTQLMVAIRVRPQ